MTVKNLILSIFFLLLPAFSAWAEVRLELSRSTISMDETVTLNLSSENRGMFRAPEIPLPEGLNIRGTSQKSTIINGQAEFTLAYTIAPTKPGTYEIGPFRLQDGEVIPAQTLTVTPAAAVRATDSLFATLELSSEDTLIRQTVELTLTFFSQQPIGDINLLDFPSEGFELSDWQEIRAGNRIVNGERYQQKRYVARLTPTQPGTLTFDPTFRVAVQERGAPRSMLFGPTRVRTKRIQLQEPVVLTVTAPPDQNRPQGYAGHIGSFRLNAEVSPNEVRVGDPITLRVALEGTGSLKQALPPHYEATDELKVYQPRVVTEDLRRDGMGGRKVLEQVVIPTSPEIKELPELQFHYFHPDTKRYETLTAGPFPITVSGEASTTLTSDSLSMDAQVSEAETLGEDLVYIKRSPGKLVRLEKLPISIGFAAGAGAPFLLWALSAVWVSKKSIQPKDLNKKRRQQASKQLRGRLSTLEDSTDLWADMWTVFSGYLRDRFSLPPGELGQDDAIAALPASVSESTREQARTWISHCEQARFGAAPQQDQEETKRAFTDFMITLDREVTS